MSLKEKLNSCFKTLSEETSDLYIPSEAAVIHHIPDPLEFLRQWVSPNVPLVIKGGAANWPAIKKWTSKYLIDVLKNKSVTVAVTPTGYADDIAKYGSEDVFVLPEERTISVADFLAKLEDEKQIKDPAVKESNGIFYLQKQDSNLTEEFSELLCDIDSNLLWATKALGKKPAAINLWIGDSRSITSLHKDPFENVYCVIKGWKEFILISPTDRPWIPYKTVRVAEYKETTPGTFQITPKKYDENDTTPSKIPWIAIDPLNPDISRYPGYGNCKPIRVRVNAGDMLYLPSLWFHHVRQSDGCIAVNFWYDMTMDIKYAYFQFLEELVKVQETINN